MILELHNRRLVAARSKDKLGDELNSNVALQEDFLFHSRGVAKGVCKGRDGTAIVVESSANPIFKS